MGISSVSCHPWHRLQWDSRLASSILCVLLLTCVTIPAIGAWVQMAGTTISDHLVLVENSRSDTPISVWLGSSLAPTSGSCEPLLSSRLRSRTWVMDARKSRKATPASSSFTCRLLVTSRK
ncbi:hypothetical protein C8R45DRAFT_1010521 [Mycena sanguinolenta]|nr:hypothetical protein C8R45DRAFT_1010521 [Mycena sanguinolenta]